MKLTPSFRYFAPASRVYAGIDSLTHIYREAQRLGVKRAFIVSSNTVARTTNLIQRTKDILGDLYAGVYDGAVKESPIPSVMAGLEAAKEAAPDLTISVGGGSAVVTARAITILLAEGGTVEDHRTKYPLGQPSISPRLMKPKLPNFLVLTTPTTGANRGGAAVMDDKPPYRLELFDPKTRPVTIILDGEALLTAPTSLFLDTSLTTFNGLIGGLQSSNLNPYSHADLKQALEISLTSIPQLLAHPDDPNPRIQLGAAALLANRASDTTNTNMGGGPRPMTIGLDRQLRYRYSHIGQGASRSVLIPAEMRRNLEIMVDGQARLAKDMGINTQGMSNAEAAEAAIQSVTDFFKSIGVATRLRDLQIPQEDFKAIAEDDTAQPAYGETTGRLSDVDQLIQVLRETW